MREKITTLGFDADDTLWHNEHLFRLTEDRFAELLAEYTDPQGLKDRLLNAEKRNILHYGYGIKSFTLSMIETAIEVTDRKVPASVVSQILEAGREILSEPATPLPYVLETLKAVKDHYRLVMITKGDLFDQERKATGSGLDRYFDALEIVSEKTPETYETLFRRHGTGAQEAMMIGNSLKSDVLPALAAGSYGTHVPFGQTRALEEADVPEASDRFYQIDHIGKVPELLARITA
ncbi:HAD family hydrolase [Roseibium alexandrii]|uniref:Putative hydrolase (HAD superfamily) n=1 Tax=Roseibium alexandrii (strain DSM 17067 / NCIMB 14079 / DFL-11) TaxID=244592 RepID=A0A5E8H4R5_ROSAD|nr:HAD family hydrolase [Roseibium alexandrii]EEE46278.1 putative hydrolase (HAD superfamily) [Roseibium alexandrii DFL-11]